MNGLMSLWNWDALRSQSQILLAPGINFVENSFSVDQIYYIYCVFSLHCGILSRSVQDFFFFLRKVF